MNTRESLILYTSQAIRKRGFYGTGIREILVATQIPKGSLYHHFPTGKVGLVQEAITFNGQIMVARLKSALKKKSAAKGLIAILELLREELLASDFALADPIALVAMEVADEHPELRFHCAAQYANWLKIISRFLEKRQVPQAGRVAQSFMGQMVGTYLLAKVCQDTSFFEAAAKTVKERSFK